MDFEQVKQQVQSALEAGSTLGAIEQLADWAASGQRPPQRADEIWLHQTLGLGLLEGGEPERARDHLKRAHELEPRDADIGIAYGQLLFEQEEGEKAVKVLRGVLIHHKTSLEPDVLAGVYFTLGSHYLGEGQLKEALTAFNDALRADPSSRASIDGMLEVISRLSPDEAKRARRRLMSRLADPSDEAYVLSREADASIESGDDELARRRIAEALERGPQTSDKIRLLRTKVALCERSGDLSGAADALFELFRVDPPEAVDDQVELLGRVAELLEEADADRARRIEVLDAVLDLSPTSLERFEAQTHLCAEAEDWAELARAYKRMIRRVRALESVPDERLEPMLWVNLGELYVAHLGQVEEGVKALVVAAQLRPRDPSVRQRVLELARGREALYEDAYRAATELLELRPDDEGARRERAQLAVLTGRYDAALTTLRVMRADDQWDSAFDSVYKRLHRPKLKIPDIPLKERHRRKYLRAETQSYVLDSLMAIGGVVFHRLFAHDLAYHKVTEKDRVELDAPLLFNQVFGKVATILGIDPPPAVYLKPNMEGMANAVLDRPAMVVGNDLLAGRAPRELVFVIAQSLSLQRPEYVLATIHEPAALKIIVLVLTNYVDSAVPLSTSRTTQTLRKELERRLSPELDKHLRETVTRLIDENLDVNVDAWVESVADEAMFTGLLLCNDVEVADRLLKRDTGALGVTCDDARMSRLHRWAMSGNHLALRKRLGLALRT